MLNGPVLSILLTFVTLYDVNVVCRCVHCQKLAPTWQQLAESFADVKAVTIAEVDCSQHASLCQQQQVS